MIQYRNAIASIETGGQRDPYRTIGPASRNGARPYGRYQVMDFNIGPWTLEVLGRAMTPQEFLEDPRAQDAVFDAKFGEAMRKYGSAEDAASVWFTGRPRAQGANRRDVLGTSGADYVNKFTKALGQDTDDMEFSAQQRTVFPAARPAAGAGAYDPDAPLSSRFLAGGPGALFGAPGGVFQNDDGTPGYDLGTALQNAGIYAMAIDNPSVLGALNRDTKEAPFGFVQGKNGRLYRVNKRTGLVEAVEGDTPERDKVDASVLTALNEHIEKWATIHDVSQRADKFADAIRSGQLDLSLASKGRAAWESIWGKSSPQTQLYNEFEAFRTELANSRLLLAKGVQTEGDARRAYDEFLSGFGRFDNATAVRQLNNIVEKNARALRAGGDTALKAYAANYNNDAVFQPYRERIEEMRRYYDEREKRAPSVSPPQVPTVALPKGVTSIRVKPAQ